MNTSSTLVVRSHVARDLLQNAALFTTEKLVVWEYVSNGLQYIDAGTNPVVNVSIDSRRKVITISDNGRGMDWLGLQNFFVMHGENADRKQGRPGRGRFGTGKSAAFGIGDELWVTSVRNNLRQRVQLSRSAIEAMGEGIEIPVTVVEKNHPTSSPNGTTIEVRGIHLKSIDQAGVIKYIERHLARWPKNCTVIVNNHECEYSDPPVSFELQFRPDGVMLEKVGDVVLTVKVSKVPLEPELRGVSIYANGVWHETTLAGSDNRDMAQYIFGDIDVPRLDEDTSPIPPFDLSRSMRLNQNNEVVQFTYAFINRCIEQVRKELVETDKNRRATEEARRLAEQASDIARLINEDFDAFRQRVAKVRAKSKGSIDRLAGINPEAVAEGDDLLFGGDIPAEAVSPVGNPGLEGEGANAGGQIPRELAPELKPSVQGGEKGRPSPPRDDQRQTTRGGFNVKFKNMGAEFHRAQYTSDERTIYVNLDHPQLRAARGVLTIDDPGFRRLAYEVAFCEYAIALASELNARDEYLDAGEPIFDIRETMNRLARRAASLYMA